MPRNYEHGIRVNAAFAYLFPVLDRPNLRVRGDSAVHRILVEGGRAHGVETIESGRLVRRHAAAVVLCAGALATPCVLLRSGIGSAAALRQLGLDVLADLPGVGAQLRDHSTVHVQDRPRSADIVPAPGAPGRNQAVLLLTAAGSTERNDLQIMPSYRAGWLALTVMLNRTTSVGSLRLTSADPLQNPAIALNYLSCDEDLDRLRAGVREAVRIMTTAVFSEITGGGMAGGPPDPSDRGLDAWIRGNVSTAAHSSGTCPIGPPDAGGVVDARGRVHGVAGLSIADVSIVPVPLRNNPNATSLMLGERFAELC
jgi:choline dehydrogenase-like flavoprotein